MCGRFTQYFTSADLRVLFGLDSEPDAFEPNYNLAPTQEAMVVFQEDKRLAKPFHFGLVPSWAKDKKIGSRLINARVETVATKPSFRAAFKRRRCLVPANGFYEWQKQGSKKVPFHCVLPEGGILALAGLWEVWHQEEGSDPYFTFAIITREASESFRAIHDRMPVILARDGFDEWLDPGNQDLVELEKVLVEKSVGELRAYPVSSEVNSVRNNGVGLVERVG